MKLLLTSEGINNEELTRTLFALAGKKPAELKVVFIPTAAAPEDEDKSWLVDDLMNFKKQGFAKLDIIDIASLDKKFWENRLVEADILVFGGGDSAYLVEAMDKVGLTAMLPNLLETTVLVGISAGSVMCGAVINPNGLKGLNLVDFLLVPHMNSQFSTRTRADIQAYASEMGKKTYWLDDNSAVVVDGKTIDVVGGGKFEIF